MDPGMADKNISWDRILVLKIQEGKTVKDVTGNVDPDLFKGGNRLHAIKDPETCMWYFKYDRGGLPETLKCKFTGFSTALRYAQNYYKKRNLDIVEVQD